MICSSCSTQRLDQTSFPPSPALCRQQLQTVESQRPCVPDTESLRKKAPLIHSQVRSRVTKGRCPTLGTGGLPGDCRLTRGLATHTMLFQMSFKVYLQTLRGWLRDTRDFISLPSAALQQRRLHFPTLSWLSHLY